ncbi:metalloregulator ArsR/SmtB family transcription factor [Bosea sp. (in: a-proteobacteria)]|uniref:ArsR/SmtB family transcription factor n=1 Tax=Bosea sp. (in: a-proteobacteria) TaxID=1871050 RepID=UPI0031FF3028
MKAKLPDSESLQDAGRLFGALSDPTRLKLLVALGQGDELCVCDLAHVAGTTISTASHHLRKLRDLGVLKHRNDGRMAYYAIRNRRVAQLASVMFSPAEASR